MRHRGIGNDPEQRFYVEMCAGETLKPARECYLAADDVATHFVRVVHLKVGTPLVVTIEVTIDDPHAKIEFSGPADMLVSPTAWIAEISFDGHSHVDSITLDDMIVRRSSATTRGTSGTELITARVWAERGERRRKFLRPPDVTMSLEIGLR